MHLQQQVVRSWRARAAQARNQCRSPNFLPCLFTAVPPVSVHRPQGSEPDLVALLSCYKLLCPSMVTLVVKSSRTVRSRGPAWLRLCQSQQRRPTPPHAALDRPSAGFPSLTASGVRTLRTCNTFARAGGP